MNRERKHTCVSFLFGKRKAGIELRSPDKEVTVSKFKVELIDLLDKNQNKIYSSDGGEYARAGIDGVTFWAERTIGVPARFAIQVLTATWIRFFVAHRIDEIRMAWNRDLPSNLWVKPFDPMFTEMWPAHHRVEVTVPNVRDRQYSWLLPTPAFEHNINLFLPDIKTVGTAYVEATKETVLDQLQLIPDDETIAVSLSGGTDSSGVLAVLLHCIRELGRTNRVYCLTLAIDGGGSDLDQARQVVKTLTPKFGGQFEHHIIKVDSGEIDRDKLRRRSSTTTEDYRILDLESAMACTLLFDAASREEKLGNLPPLRFEFNGDGGNEIFLDYPLTGRGHRPIPMEDVWRNPHLFLLGYGKSSLTNPVYSAGLSRGYTRTFCPAREHDVMSFSPLIDRRVIEVGTKIPLRNLAPTEDELHKLRGLAVQAGVLTLTGVKIPVCPKTMFQDGASSKPGLIRVSEEESLALKATILRG
ncbi:MAG: hypothetical protein HYV41_04795 [Candidatus Magasanikbacteria bacterium]|nr:hypothetical protein [Candidatus Magasanikbacteria bacterium]